LLLLLVVFVVIIAAAAAIATLALSVAHSPLLSFAPEVQKQAASDGRNKESTTCGLKH
jgi:hypothetical protein